MKKYLLILLLFLLSYLNLASNFRYLFLNAFSYPILYLRNISLEVGDFYTFYLNIEKIRKENIELKNKVSDVELKQLTYNLSRFNDIELERINNLFKNDTFFEKKQISVGEVVYYNLNNSTILVINNDNNFKVKVGALVLHGRSLVGIVSNLNNNLLEIRLVSSRDFNLNTFVVNKELLKIRTVLTGDKFDALSINNILATESIEEGDVVVTSSTNEGIPSDLVIGQLDRIENISSQTFRKASVKKLYDLNVIKYVGIMNNDK